MSEPSQEAHGIRLDSKWQFLWIFYQCSTNVRLEIFIGWRHWMRKWVYGGIGGGWQGAEPEPQFLTKLQRDKYLRIQKKHKHLVIWMSPLVYKTYMVVVADGHHVHGFCSTGRVFGMDPKVFSSHSTTISKIGVLQLPRKYSFEGIWMRVVGGGSWWAPWPRFLIKTVY